MTTTKIAPAFAGRARYWCLGGGLLGLAVLLVVFWPRQPPQMGADSEVFHTVDVLFTAVTARDEKALGQCEQRLRAYRQKGKLPAAAGDALDQIVVTAKSGRWASAAESLYEFMRGQRREGVVEQRLAKKDKRHPR